jgi:hypothetical protein
VHHDAKLDRSNIGSDSKQPVENKDQSSSPATGSQQFEPPVPAPTTRTRTRATSGPVGFPVPPASKRLKRHAAPISNPNYPADATPGIVSDMPPAVVHSLPPGIEQKT